MTQHMIDNTSVSPDINTGNETDGAARGLGNPQSRAPLIFRCQDQADCAVRDDTLPSCHLLSLEMSPCHIVTTATTIVSAPQETKSGDVLCTVQCGL